MVLEINRLTGGLCKVEGGLGREERLGNDQYNYVIKIYWLNKTDVEIIALL